MDSDSVDSSGGSRDSFNSFSQEECKRRLSRALEHSSFVKFMLEKMEEAGCAVERSVDIIDRRSSSSSSSSSTTSASNETLSTHPSSSSSSSSFFTVEYCDGANSQVVGGFRPEGGVALCHNNLTTQTDLEATLTHELIHAYDHCRAKGMDWTNCEHHACTEIRAANLSGDCHFSQEMARGNLANGFYKQHQRCVKRRALLSVEMNPHCKGKDASNAVNNVFNTCFNDTAPFAWIP